MKGLLTIPSIAKSRKPPKIMRVHLYAITVGLFIYIYMYALVVFSVFSKT